MFVGGRTLGKSAKMNTMFKDVQCGCRGDLEASAKQMEEIYRDEEQRLKASDKEQTGDQLVTALGVGGKGGLFSHQPA